MVQLTLRSARGDETQLRTLEVPADYFAGLPAALPARNVGSVYARIAEDIRTGSRSAPSFADAVELHRLIDRIEKSAAGQ